MQVHILYDPKDEDRLNDMKLAHDRFYNYLMNQIPRGVEESEARLMVLGNKDLLNIKEAIEKLKNSMIPNKIVLKE